MKHVMGLALLLALACALPATAADNLPAIGGPSGQVKAGPVAIINPNGGSPCVWSSSCVMPVSGTGTFTVVFSSAQPVTQSSGPWSVSWSGQSVSLSGTLPAFTATPTFNLGTIGTAATAANQTAIQANAGSDASKAVAVQGVTGGKPVSVSGSASTTGGASTYSADGGTNALLTGTVVQAGSTAAHSLYGVWFANTNASDVWCQVFDLASGSVTLGTTRPKVSWRIPGGSSTNAGFWEEKFTGEGKIAFATAISIACTTTAIGSTAPGSAVQALIVYQ